MSHSAQNGCAMDCIRCTVTAVPNDPAARAGGPEDGAAGSDRPGAVDRGQSRVAPAARRQQDAVRGRRVPGDDRRRAQLTDRLPLRARRGAVLPAQGRDHAQGHRGWRRPRTSTSRRARSSCCPATPSTRPVGRRARWAWSWSGSAARTRRSPITWYCDKCGNQLYQFVGVITDLGTQLKPVMEHSSSSLDLRTCGKCGTCGAGRADARLDRGRRGGLSVRSRVHDGRPGRRPHPHPAADRCRTCGSALGMAAGRASCRTARGAPGSSSTIASSGTSRRTAGTPRRAWRMRPRRRRASRCSRPCPVMFSYWAQAADAADPRPTAQRPPGVGRRAAGRRGSWRSRACRSRTPTWPSRSWSAASASWARRASRSAPTSAGMEPGRSAAAARSGGGTGPGCRGVRPPLGHAGAGAHEPLLAAVAGGHAHGAGARVLRPDLRRRPGPAARGCASRSPTAAARSRALGASRPVIAPGPTWPRHRIALSPRHYLDRFWVDSLVHDPAMLRYWWTHGRRPRRAGHRLSVPAGRGATGRHHPALHGLTPAVSARTARATTRSSSWAAPRWSAHDHR